MGFLAQVTFFMFPTVHRLNSRGHCIGPKVAGSTLNETETFFESF